MSDNPEERDSTPDAALAEPAQPESPAAAPPATPTPTTALPSIVPRSAEEGLQQALDALRPTLQPAASPDATDAGAPASDTPAQAAASADGDAEAAIAPALGLASAVLAHARPVYDPGAQTAARAIARRSAAEPYLLLAGKGGENERARALLLEHMAERAQGVQCARLCSAAAEQWQRLAEPARASELFARAQAADTRDANAVRELRKQAVAARDHARAAQLLEQEAGFALAPEELALLWSLRAELERARADAGAASLAIEESLRCKPSVSAWLVLAEQHARAGRDRESAEALDSAAALWQDAGARGGLWLAAGLAFERCGDTARAQDAFARAHGADRNLLDAALYDQRISRARGDAEGTARALERLSAGLQSEPFAEDLTRARAQWLAGMRDRSGDALRLLASTRSEPSLRLRARLAERAGAWVDRRDALELSARDAAGSERMLALLALCELHIGRGEFDAARSALREAARIDRGATLVRTMASSLARAAGTSEAPGDEVAEVDEILEAAARAARDVHGAEQELALLLRAAGHARSAELIALDLEAELGRWDGTLERLAREVEQAGSPALRAGFELARRDLRDEHARHTRISMEDAPARGPLALIHRTHRVTDVAQHAALWLELAGEMRGEVAAGFATLAGDFGRASGNAREAYERALAAAPGYAPACWALERLLAGDRGGDDRPALARVHAALARGTSDPLERAARELRMAGLADAGAALPPNALSSPSDAFDRDRALAARSESGGLALAELLESSGRSMQGALATLAKLRAAALYEDIGETGRAAVIYREQLDVSGGRDAHAALGLARVLDDAGRDNLLFDHLQRTAQRIPDTRARREALEDLATLQSERGELRAAAITANALLEIDPDCMPALRARQREAMELADLGELADRSERIARRVGDRNARAAQLRLAARARKLLGHGARLLPEDAALGLWHAFEVARAAQGRGDVPVQAAQWLELCAHVRDPDERLFFAQRAAGVLEGAAPARALAALSPHVHGAPRQPFAHELLARVRQASGDAAGAARDAEQAARVAVSASNRARLWYRAATLWQDSVGDDARARAALEAVVAIDIVHRDAFERLRRLLSDASDWPALCELLARRIDAGAESQLLLGWLIERARLLTRLGQPDAAKSALQHVTTLAPARVDALRALADLHIQSAEWREAADALVRVARLIEDRAALRDVFLTLGRIYSEHVLDLRRAEIAYARAVALDQGDKRAIEALMQVFKRSGDHERALRACERLLDLAQSDAEYDRLTVVFAGLLEAKGELLRAERALNDRREQRPASAPIIAALNDLYTRQHDETALRVHLDRSIHALRQGVLEQPDDAMRITGLAGVLLRRGRIHAAASVAALALDLGHSDARLSQLATHFRPLGAAALSARAVEHVWPKPLSESRRELLWWIESKGRVALTPIARGERVTNPPPALRRAFATVQACVEVRDLGWVIGDGRQILPLQSRPPTIALGRELLETSEADELAFLLVRAIAIARLGLAAVASADPDEIAALLAPPPAASATSAAQAASGPLAKLGARQRSELQALVRRAAAQGTLDAHALRAAVLELGSRIALLALGTCSAGIAALRAPDGDPGAQQFEAHDLASAVVPGSEAHALLSFALSDAYIELRTQLEPPAEAVAK